LKNKEYIELAYAKYDLKREKIKGFPEVILGSGKSDEHLAGIVKKVISRTKKLLITKITERQFSIIEESLQSTSYVKKAKFHKSAGLVYIGDMPKNSFGKVVVVCGGTSDYNVSEEAALTLEIFGSKVERLYDVGVAGIHRLLTNLDYFKNANAVVVAAGMEGALPSVVTGLVSCPVIGVPTSVGYGTNFKGVSALLTMLNSCAVGLSVVNIDNGFGAAYQAHIINKLISKK
jgi:NCAIR mutase (PurE)-related protein